MTKKQVRNRYSSAGITAREAERLLNYMRKIEAIANKNNLYVGYASNLKMCGFYIRKVLREANRL